MAGSWKYASNLVYILREYEMRVKIMVMWCVKPCDLVNKMPMSNHTTSCYISEEHEFCMRCPDNCKSHTHSLGVVTQSVL